MQIECGILKNFSIFFFQLSCFLGCSCSTYKVIDVETLVNLIDYSRVLQVPRRNGDDINPKRALANRRVCISSVLISFSQ